jgi:hypothetical protein
MIERLFAFRVLDRLHDAKTKTFGGFLSARFFGIQRFALNDQAMKSGVLFRFGLAKWRQCRCGISLNRRGLRSALGAFADSSGSDGQCLFGDA